MARIRRSHLLVVLTVLGSLFALNVPLVAAQSSSQVQADARHLDQVAQEVDSAVADANWTTARADWREFGEVWLDVEDGFRDLSRDGYARIESNMVTVGDGLRVDAPNAAAVRQALRDLRTELAPFMAGAVTSGSASAVRSAPGGLDGLMDTLDRTIAAAERQDVESAYNGMRSFQTQWLDVEGQVKTRNAQTYRSTEDNMAHATALLRSASPNTADALVTMRTMRQELAPLVGEPARYGVLDAAIIMLREGLEALLVVAALLAFLNKSGHSDKQRWIWAGAGAGVLLSVLVALAIQRMFSSAAAGASRELVEGLTGLLAAAMLVYVSYWLHSKSSLDAWQRYVRQRTTAALAGGGILSLALISFLSVFREGAETALFYIGIAPSIAGGDLALGIGLGTAALAVIGVVMLVFGLRIPLRPFFLVSSVLLYYLAFKFVGTGLHALQVAGALSATPAAVPSWDPVGLFPTWETTLPQLALLLLATGVLVLSRARARPARMAAQNV
jgi:high-affinity iron transporter